MPWKEPGDKPREPRGREPWGPRKGGHGGGGPDLEAWFKKFRRSLGPFGHGPLGALALLVLLIVLWFLVASWTSIGGQQVGVLLRFGRFEGLLQPGLHAHLPTPIDRVEKIDMGGTRVVGDEARLLTRDDQLVLVDYEVHYKITNVRDFLFATRDADEVVRNTATQAARAAVGSHTLRCLIAELGVSCPSGRIGDEKLAEEIRGRLDAALADSGRSVGIAVNDVKVQDIGVPSDVSQAFDAIAKAHTDVKAAKASAEADVTHGKVKAKNKAASIKAAAQAYDQNAVAEADAAVARFDRVLTQYRAAPEVTRHLLWLDAMQDVLSKNRVVVNTGSGNVVVQFPVQHPGKKSAHGHPASPASAASTAKPAPSTPASVPVTRGPGMQAVD